MENIIQETDLSKQIKRAAIHVEVKRVEKLIKSMNKRLMKVVECQGANNNLFMYMGYYMNKMFL